MISDVLSDAVDEIDRYLAEPDSVYVGKIRHDLYALRDSMDAMRARLDTPPPPAPRELEP